jgi:hypothetical protein
MNTINLFFPDDLLLNKSYKFRCFEHGHWVEVEVVYIGRNDCYYEFSFKNYLYQNIQLTHYYVSKNIHEIL